MAFINDFKYSTELGITPHGVKFRIDIVPCTETCLDGSLCGELQRIYFRFRDPVKNVFRNKVVYKCRHWREKHLSPTYLDWDKDMDLAYLDELSSCQSTGSLTDKWEHIHQAMTKRFPTKNFKYSPKLETRPGKGRFKEWRGSVRDHYEDLIDCANDCGDVWDESISRNSANSTVVRNPTKREQFESKTEKVVANTTLTDFNMVCPDCGHERFAHDSRGFCTAIGCRKFCRSM